MKKILIPAFLVLAAVGIALLISDHPGKSYPRNDVTTALNSGAIALGSVVEEQRTVSGHLRTGESLGRVRAWLRGVTTGDETLDDIDEHSVRRGADKVTITSLHRKGDVHELRIRPSPSNSKLSSDLKREILKSLPGVKFKP